MRNRSLAGKHSLGIDIDTSWLSRAVENPGTVVVVEPEGPT